MKEKQAYFCTHKLPVQQQPLNMSVDAYGGSGTKNMYHVWPTDLDEQPLAYMENEGFGFTLGSVSCRYGAFGCVCVVRSGQVRFFSATPTVGGKCIASAIRIIPTDRDKAEKSFFLAPFLSHVFKHIGYIHQYLYDERTITCGRVQGLGCDGEVLMCLFAVTVSAQAQGPKMPKIQAARPPTKPEQLKENQSLNSLLHSCATSSSPILQRNQLHHKVPGISSPTFELKIRRAVSRTVTCTLNWAWPLCFP